MANEHELESLARAAGRPLGETERERLADAVDRARAHSSVALSLERLGAAIGRHLRPGEDLEAAATWELCELHLAAAAIDGEAAAVRAIERLLGEAAATALGRRGFSRAEIDELVQELLVKLVVGGPGGARLASYSGRGRLGGYLRAAALRAGLNRRRSETRAGARAIEQRLETVLDEPELRHLKQAYLARFREALAAAWRELPAERQLLLRHQVEDGLSIDELARLLGVHRATAARRLAAARDELARATRQRLRAELGLDDAELDSVMHLIRSRLGDAADALG